MTRAILINDTSGENHTGCNAVKQGFKSLARRHGIDIIQWIPRNQFVSGQVKIKDADLWIWNGEGNLHHSKSGDKGSINAYFWNVLYRANRPLVLVNTVWDDFDLHDEVRELFNQKVSLVSCRESCSSRQVVRSYEGPVYITPDVIFELARLNPEDWLDGYQSFVGKGIGYSDFLGAYGNHKLNSPNCKPLQISGNPHHPYAYLAWLSGLKGYISGRFHGICLAAIAGTPVIALPHNSCKNLGIMQDSGNLEYFKNSFADAEMAINLGGADFTEYTEAAPVKLNLLFERILEQV